MLAARDAALASCHDNPPQTTRGHGNRVFLGEPIDPKVDVGLALHNGKDVQVYEISGSSALDPHARVTSNILTVAKLLTPLSRDEVPVVRALGLNYSDHADEAAHLAGREKVDLPKFPMLFYKPSTSLIPSGDPIVLPSVVRPYAEHLPDYEVELVIVIGRDTKNVTEEDALDYVLGYTGANDVSFRKWQNAIPQWGFSKSFDDTNPLGPVLVSFVWAVTFQKLNLLQGLQARTTGPADYLFESRVQCKQIFNVRKTISFLSQSTTLPAGTIIMTGTPAGVGFVRREKLWLKPGDEIRCEVGGGIGTLINSVIEEKPKSKL
ncbi:SubName: Full=Related to bifunctional 4-hydroxyphenylacetate degradation enzyme {ECO:0000313/EMBL:CCA69960.1} [Serendipita indica DSM 11827]|nr:SubName: Full=Related to bifunctional 4-hydroxyphenylacetate degradation enzyme {ECO:0000313/EMBL:CCA69960.1} [Serendipita indica DSM 11827]